MQFMKVINVRVFKLATTQENLKCPEVLYLLYKRLDKGFLKFNYLRNYFITNNKLWGWIFSNKQNKTRINSVTYFFQFYIKTTIHYYTTAGGKKNLKTMWVKILKMNNQNWNGLSWLPILRNGDQKSADISDPHRLYCSFLHSPQCCIYTSLIFWVSSFMFSVSWKYILVVFLFFHFLFVFFFSLKGAHFFLILS